MKKIFLLLSLIAFFAFSSRAVENYPYQSDYMWVTIPDHADWTYNLGQNAKVEVMLLKYGMPQNVTVNYTIADDMLQPFTSGSVELKNGRGFITLPSPKRPGFRDIAMDATINGVTYRHHIKLGFAPDKIMPHVKEPADFTSFWKKNIDKTRETPLRYTIEPAPEYSTDKVECSLVKLYIDDKGHAIYGYLSKPRDAKPGTLPAVMCPPGAGIKTIKLPARNHFYPENGFMRFEIEIHGLDPRMTAEEFKEISTAVDNGNGGYLGVGVDDKDKYYMKRVYTALVKANDFLTSLPEWDGKNLIMQGGSQGGALSIIATALDPRVTLCVANHPALTDMEGYAVEGHTGGYPHFNRIDGFLTRPDYRNTLSYYDVINFGRHVNVPVYMTWGYNDNTCPPTTSYALWNTLTYPKEALITPVNEHWTSRATNVGQMEWIKSHLK
ncbi:MAG: acetylxylan esterase [Lachnoclostridium sp.]|nr:acetylxylan esterase [Lachnoclostridium sp.]